MILKLLLTKNLWWKGGVSRAEVFALLLFAYDKHPDKHPLKDVQ